MWPLLYFLVGSVHACPPQPNGNCYAGRVGVGTGVGGFANQRCGSTPNQDWCAVSYQPYANEATFACANTITGFPGAPICGDGPGFVNSQGCSVVNTANGPCYLCCCRGGSCNNPRTFAREAARLPIGQGVAAPQWGYWNSSPSIRVSISLLFSMFVYAVVLM